MFCCGSVISDDRDREGVPRDAPAVDATVTPNSIQSTGAIRSDAPTSLRRDPSRKQYHYAVDTTTKQAVPPLNSSPSHSRVDSLRVGLPPAVAHTSVMEESNEEFIRSAPGSSIVNVGAISPSSQPRSPSVRLRPRAASPDRGAPHFSVGTEFFWDPEAQAMAVVEDTSTKTSDVPEAPPLFGAGDVPMAPPMFGPDVPMAPPPPGAPGLPGVSNSAPSTPLKRFHWEPLRAISPQSFWARITAAKNDGGDGDREDDELDQLEQMFRRDDDRRAAVLQAKGPAVQSLAQKLAEQLAMRGRPIQHQLNEEAEESTTSSSSSSSYFHAGSTHITTTTTTTTTIRPLMAATPPSARLSAHRVCLLQEKRAHKLEILLRGLKTDFKLLPDAVVDLNLQLLTPERLVILQDCLPTEEESALVKSYVESGVQNAWESLGVPETFVWILSFVTCFSFRVKMLLLIFRFDSLINSLETSFHTLIQAVECIKSSEELRSVLATILSIGNILNRGTNRSGACGFRIHTLEKLSSIKSSNIDAIPGKHHSGRDGNHMTLLDFVVEYTAKKRIRSIQTAQRRARQQEEAEKRALRLRQELAEEQEFEELGHERAQEDSEEHHRSSPPSTIPNGHARSASGSRSRKSLSIVTSRVSPQMHPLTTATRAGSKGASPQAEDDGVDSPREDGAGSDGEADPADVEAEELEQAELEAEQDLFDTFDAFEFETQPQQLLHQGLIIDAAGEPSVEPLSPRTRKLEFESRSVFEKLEREFDAAHVSEEAHHEPSQGITSALLVPAPSTAKGHVRKRSAGGSGSHHLSPPAPSTVIVSTKPGHQHALSSPILESSSPRTLKPSDPSPPRPRSVLQDQSFAAITIASGDAPASNVKGGRSPVLAPAPSSTLAPPPPASSRRARNRSGGSMSVSFSSASFSRSRSTKTPAPLELPTTWDGEPYLNLASPIQKASVIELKELEEERAGLLSHISKLHAEFETVYDTSPPSTITSSSSSDDSDSSPSSPPQQLDARTGELGWSFLEHATARLSALHDLSMQATQSMESLVDYLGENSSRTSAQEVFQVLSNFVEKFSQAEQYYYLGKLKCKLLKPDATTACDTSAAVSSVPTSTANGSSFHLSQWLEEWRLAELAELARRAQVEADLKARQEEEAKRQRDAALRREAREKREAQRKKEKELAAAKKLRASDVSGGRRGKKSNVRAWGGGSGGGDADARRQKALEYGHKASSRHGAPKSPVLSPSAMTPDELREREQRLLNQFHHPAPLDVAIAEGKEEISPAVSPRGHQHTFSLGASAAVYDRPLAPLTTVINDWRSIEIPRLFSRAMEPTLAAAGVTATVPSSPGSPRSPTKLVVRALSPAASVSPTRVPKSPRKSAAASPTTASIIGSPSSTPSNQKHHARTISSPTKSFTDILPSEGAASPLPTARAPWDILSSFSNAASTASSPVIRASSTRVLTTPKHVRSPTASGTTTISSATLPSPNLSRTSHVASTGSVSMNGFASHRKSKKRNSVGKTDSSGSTPTSTGTSTIISAGHTFAS